MCDFYYNKNWKSDFYHIKRFIVKVELNALAFVNIQKLIIGY